MEKKTFFAQNEELVVLHDKCSPLFTLCGRSGSMWFDNRFPTLSEVKARDNHGQHSRITDDSDVVQVRCAHVTVSKMASVDPSSCCICTFFFKCPYIIVSVRPVCQLTSFVVGHCRQRCWLRCVLWVPPSSSRLSLTFGEALAGLAS